MPISYRRAIKLQHGGTATLARSMLTRETFEGKAVGEGVVHVFDVTGHPKAMHAYARPSPVKGSTKRRFFAVPHSEQAKSPVEAVHEAIVAEDRQK